MEELKSASSVVVSTVMTHATPPSSSLPVMAGCAAFGSTLAASTLLQLKLLGVSTGSPRPITTALGLVSVALASLASHGACLKTHSLCKEHLPTSFLWKRNVKNPPSSSGGGGGSSSSLPASNHSLALSTRSSSRRSLKHPKQQHSVWSDDSISIGPVHVEKSTLRICALGVLAFKLLGGRFWAIAPSSYTNLGSFARFSLPATERYATAAERAALNRLGRRVGCHTCGSHMLWGRKGVVFHGDHMPPRAVANQMNRRWFRRLFGIKVKYRFFPQCVDCSKIQGGILGKATGNMKKSTKWWWWNTTPNLAGAGGGRLAHYHGLRFRPYHLSGGVIAAVTVAGATEEDIKNGNRRRYRDLQEGVEHFALETWAKIKTLSPPQ